MAVLFSLGNTLVDSKEISAKKSSLKNLKKKNGKVDFRSGTVLARGLTQNKVSFTPIGIGKPLSLQIMNVYTGDAPKKTLGSAKDLLIASATKYMHLSNAQPRAINQVYRKVESRKLYGPSAFDEGCPVIYYSPAVEADSIVSSVEIMASKFDKTSYDTISGFLGKAGLTPLFAPHSSSLMLGSTVVNIASKLGKSLLNKKDPYLRDDIIIEFNTPDVVASYSELILICNGRDKRTFLNSYKPVAIKEKHSSREVFLQHKQTGKPYDGAAPYMIVSMDGRERTELNDFQPKLASAALMQEFYSEDTTIEATTLLDDAMGLYNDFMFHTKANDLKAKLKKMKPNSADFETELARFKAFQKNIQNKKFKVTASGIPKKKS